MRREQLKAGTVYGVHESIFGVQPTLLLDVESLVRSGNYGSGRSIRRTHGTATLAGRTGLLAARVYSWHPLDWDTRAALLVEYADRLVGEGRALLLKGEGDRDVPGIEIPHPGGPDPETGQERTVSFHFVTVRPREIKAPWPEWVQAKKAQEEADAAAHRAEKERRESLVVRVQALRSQTEAVAARMNETFGIVCQFGPGTITLDLDAAYAILDHMTKENR